MPVTTTFPGIYIEEIKVHPYDYAAPTSIAVFVGYTHPSRQELWTSGAALRFTDYEKRIRGFFSNSAFDDPDKFGSLPTAVNTVFPEWRLGMHVVGLQATPLAVARRLRLKSRHQPLQSAVWFHGTRADRRKPRDNDPGLII